jgi:hypothetical protein
MVNMFNCVAEKYKSLDRKLSRIHWFIHIITHLNSAYDTACHNNDQKTASSRSSKSSFTDNEAIMRATLFNLSLYNIIIIIIIITIIINAYN